MQKGGPSRMKASINECSLAMRLAGGIPVLGRFCKMSDPTIYELIGRARSWKQRKRRGCGWIVDYVHRLLRRCRAYIASFPSHCGRSVATVSSSQGKGYHTRGQSAVTSHTEGLMRSVCYPSRTTIISGRCARAWLPMVGTTREKSTASNIKARE